MAGPSRRDRSVERLLEGSFEAALGEPPDGCADAETLAAWTSGVLPAAKAEAVEAHVSSCARCQAMLAAFIRSEPAGTPAGAPPLTRHPSPARWILPVAAAAVVVLAVALVVTRRSASLVPEPTMARVDQPDAGPAGAIVQPPAAAGETGTAAQLKSQAAASALAATPPPATSTNAAADRARAGGNTPADAIRSSTPTTRTAEAAPPHGSLRDGAEVVSPDPDYRWRVTAEGVVQRTTTGGAVWESVAIDPPVTPLAGDAPSLSVCWLVGGGGLVLRSFDGLRFYRVPFPEPVTLTAVTSTDASHATVTAEDGRQFATSDAGRTWSRVTR